MGIFISNKRVNLFISKKKGKEQPAPHHLGSVTSNSYF